MKTLLKMTGSSRLLILAMLIVAALLACGGDDEPENTPPSISAQTFSASEAAAAGDAIGTVTGSDADGDDLTFSITANDNDLFAITSAGELSVASGQGLDFETATSHSITVQVSDGQAQASATVTVNVVDVAENTAPTIAAQSFKVAEDIADDAVIGTVSATDAESDDLTFSITNNAGNLFEITTLGQLSLAAGMSLDFETATSHEITVQVSDGMLNASAQISITVTDVAENTAPIIDDQEFTVAEDISDAEVIGSIVATDAEGDAITLSITTNDQALFEITSGGELSLASGQSLDFETATSHTITVEATDGGMSATATITINVTDVDETVPSANYTVTTFAGSTEGFMDGEGVNAMFNRPHSVAVDAMGNVYVTDTGNKRIRKITPEGVVSTIAGSGATALVDDQGLSASFRFPRDILVTDDGTLYVSDENSIRAITSTFAVSTIAGNGVSGYNDGQGVTALFKANEGIALDNDGNIIVADTRNQRIRKIDATSGMVTTIAGLGSQGDTNGPALSATFRNPVDVAVDANGNIFVLEEANERIRKIGTDNMVTTFTGLNGGFVDGDPSMAKFDTPSGLTMGADGNLYVTDTNNIAIRKVDANGNVTTIAGGNQFGSTDGKGNVAQFSFAERLAVDSVSGAIYVADTGNHRIRKIVMN